MDHEVEDEELPEPPYLANQRFFELADLCGLPPNGTLAGASGFPAYGGPYPTTLVERVEQAWGKRYTDLTCYDVADLLIQKFGLEWLAKSIVDFATRYPDADAGHYPGEMVANMLAAAEEFHRFASSELELWLKLHADDAIRLFTWSRKLREQVESNLEQARSLY